MCFFFLFKPFSISTEWVVPSIINVLLSFFLSMLSHPQSSLSSFPQSENEETFPVVKPEWAWSRTGMMLITVIDNMQSRYYGWSNKLKVWLINYTRWEAKVWPRTVQIHLRGMWMSMPICFISMVFILGHHIMTLLMSHPDAQGISYFSQVKTKTKEVRGFMKGWQHLVSDRMLTPFPGEVLCVTPTSDRSRDFICL